MFVLHQRYFFIYGALKATDGDSDNMQRTSEVALFLTLESAPESCQSFTSKHLAAYEFRGIQKRYCATL